MPRLVAGPGINLVESPPGTLTVSTDAIIADTLIGDGVTDNRAALAALVAANRGKQIIIPEGNYAIATGGGSITLEEVSLVGENVLDGATASIDQGANFFITGTTNSPFKVRRGVSVAGLGFFYPSQTDSATPTAYPATFAFDFTNGAVQFVRLHRNAVYNAYKFLEIDNGATGAVGHVEITENYICALNRAIYLRYNAEHIRIERNNFTFGFWLAATEGGARGYMRANATAFQVDQSDGAEFTDNLVLGHLNGVLLSATALCQFMKISENKFDNVRYPIRAVGAGNFTGQITANTFNAFNGQNTALQGRSISIETTGTGLDVITITGNQFQAATEDHIYTTGNAASRQLAIGLNSYTSWAAYKSTGTYGALNINGSLTNVVLGDGFFYGGNNVAHSYGIMGTFNVFSMNGAVFDGCQRVLNVSVSFITGAANRSFNTGDTVSDVYGSGSSRMWGPNMFDKPQDKTPITITLSAFGNYANDGAAATAGVPVGGFYRNGSVIQVRTV